MSYSISQPCVFVAKSEMCFLICRNLFDVFLKPYFLEAYRPVHRGMYVCMYVHNIHSIVIYILGIC